MSIQKNTQSVFIQSAKGLANTLAVAVTFFGTPPLYNATVRWVADFTTYNYGAGLDDFVSFCWFLTCGACVFFGARMSLSTALIMGAMTFATRVL